MHFNFVFAALGTSLASLPEGHSLRPCFQFDLVGVLLSSVFAALGPSLASFTAVDAEFEVEGWDFSELKCLLDDSLFIFGSFGSASASLLFVIVIGRLFVLLNGVLLMAMTFPFPPSGLLLVLVLLLQVHLIGVLLPLRFVIIILTSLQLLQFTRYFLVFVVGDDDSFAIFLTFDFHFGEVGDVRDVGFALAFEDHLVGTVGCLVEVLACIRDGLPSRLCELLANKS